MGKANKCFLLEQSRLTKDVLYDLPEIYMEGRQTIRVLNHKGITKFSKEQVILLMKDGRMCIDGDNLEVKSFDEDAILIFGNLKRVEFLT